MTLVSAKIQHDDIFILIPDNPVYEKNVIEIMAPFNIRDSFGLKDRGKIEVIVD
jgi:CTP-dependent riboflavin kinase